MDKPTRRKCNRLESVRIYYDIKADSTKQFYWFCEQCECLAVRGTFMAHSVAMAHLDTLPEHILERFWRDRLRNDNSKLVQCAVCGESGAQLHHFAPQSMIDHFGSEWGRWPTAYLCAEHHRLWHEVVTWYMLGYKQREAEFLQRYYGTTRS